VGNQEFETPQDALAHFGKKGMRWGIRNDDKPGSSRGPASREKKSVDVDAFKKASDEFFAAKKPGEVQADGQKKLKEQQDQTFPSRKDEKRQAKADKIQNQANEIGDRAKDLEIQRDALGKSIKDRYLRVNKSAQINELRQIEANLNKQADQVREGKLTDQQKKLLAVGAAVAVTGLAVYGTTKYNEQKHGFTKDVKNDLERQNRERTDAEWKAIFGKEHPGSVSKLGYVGAVNGPPKGGFHHTLESKKAWDIPEFTLPEGTVFQRLSNAAEDVTQYGKPRGAYATFLSNDKKLYGASFEFGTSSHAVTFQSKGPTKVASLPTIMSHLAAIRQRDSPHQTHDEKSLFSEYYLMAGAGWKYGDSIKLMESLKSSGYGAIVDHMDAGFMGDLPIVFFGEARRGAATPRTKADQIGDHQGLLKVGAQYK
jgi:hypothetical protein